MRPHTFLYGERKGATAAPGSGRRRRVQLPGARGFLPFVTPVLSKPLEVKVRLVKDAVIVSLTSSFTSVLAGFTILSATGYMAHRHDLPVDNKAIDGAAVRRTCGCSCLADGDGPSCLSPSSAAETQQHHVLSRSLDSCLRW
ncbi:hypothetical protein Q5P01_014481 [Channa striata]|uniref:Uncharacterized protein n=1 Tax=Channa striata TaxID=64152 RepID=A0AA88MGE5_CHASR|nr:hypothetical protein Q5P01_014481 [Channa striata]